VDFQVVRVLLEFLGEQGQQALQDPRGHLVQQDLSVQLAQLEQMDLMEYQDLLALLGVAGQVAPERQAQQVPLELPDLLEILEPTDLLDRREQLVNGVSLEW